MPRELESVLRVVNPFTGDATFDVPFDSPAEVDRKLDRARSAQRRWQALPLDRRTQQVASALEYFRTNGSQVARDITVQMGKPIQQSRREVDTLLGRADHMLVLAKYALAHEVLPSAPGITLRIEHRPHGVVLDIAAWNYPLLVPGNVVIPALLAGNAVILKHSPLTPSCGVHFERAFSSLSVPGLLQHLVLENERAEKLIEDPRIDYVSFTGSVATGRKVYAAAARRLIDAGLELGGKDPAYVAEDADVDFAAENIVDGACYNAGQSCCAVERVYVHEKVYEEFLERARSAMKAYRLGDPLDDRTTLGPLARREAIATLEKQIEDAVARGATVTFRGKRPPGKGQFFEPTILAGVPNDGLAMQEESFGPILPVAIVASDDEAIAKMNDSRYGLTASVWTRASARAESFAASLEAGTVYQNRCDVLDPALPWTGWKQSGIGSSLSRYGFHQLTKRKSIHFRAGS
ncbi:MAG TPA: aldehyde dehydrogenase family protein [Planctomycetota bacterium]|jgi:acyl-CoA reductase-like NAD-dependent aldehyde dehydrogenase|nr:aldehyde dehydrogenase family protein [Planctomycetota bacterium]